MSAGMAVMAVVAVVTSPQINDLMPLREHNKHQ